MNTILKKAGILLVAVCVCIAFTPLMNSGTAYGKSIKLSKKTLYLAKGKKAKLKVKGTKSKPQWASSAPGIATVSKKGKVKGVASGTALITATVNGKTLTCTVYVMDKYSVKAKALRNKILKKKGRKMELKMGGDDDSTTRVIIKANKKNNNLVFQRIYTSDTSEGGNSMTVTIDLIGNQVGTIEYKADPDGCSYERKGTITRDFTEKGKGVNVLYNKETTTEDGSVTYHPITAEDNEIMAYRFIAASGDFNYLLKKKAKGFTMKKIGFMSCK